VINSSSSPSGDSSEFPVTLGEFSRPGIEISSRMYSDNSPISTVLNRPWFRSFLQTKGVYSPPDKLQRGEAKLSEEILKRHTVILGKTGAGKSVITHSMLHQMWAAGCSAVVIEVKGESITEMQMLALDAGVPGDKITILSPERQEVGWNPFLVDGTPTEVASQFTEAMRSVHSSWGPRMGNILTNAALIIAAHKLSLYELFEFLTHLTRSACGTALKAVDLRLVREHSATRRTTR